MKQKNLLLLLGVIVVIGILFLSGIISFTIIGASQIEFINGKDYWVITQSVDRLGDTHVFTAKADDTREQFNVTISPINGSCSYRLVKSVDAVGLCPIVVYKPDYPEKHIFISVSTSKSAESRIYDAGITNVDYILNDHVFVGSKGYVQGISECPPNNFVLFKGSDGSTKAIDASQWSYTRSQCAPYCSGGNQNMIGLLSCMVALSTQKPPIGFENSFSNVQAAYDSGKEKFTGILKSAAYGAALVVVKADATYFPKYQFAPAPAANPKVLSCSDVVANEERQATLTFRVKNDGNAGTVTFKVTSPRATISQGFFTDNMGAGEIKDYPLVFSAGETSMASEKSSYTVTVSSQQEGGATNQDSKTCSLTIKDSANPISENCGNGKCEPLIGESASTCSQDCKIQPTCPEKSGRDNQGNCVCQSGYSPNYDNDGKLSCTPEINWLLIFFVVLVAVIVLVLIYPRRGKK